jgi:hypothetical protein
MRRWRKFLPLVLLTPAVILSAPISANSESKSLSRYQHKTQAAPHLESVQQQHPEIPLSVWQRTQAALDESLATIKQQAEVAQKQTKSNQETWHSPAVIVQIVLAFVGIGYLIFTYLQWVSTRPALIANRRAFLSVENLMPFFDSPIDGVYRWRFRATWRNTGATPTRNMTMYVTCELRDTILPRITCSSTK